MEYDYKGKGSNSSFIASYIVLILIFVVLSSIDGKKQASWMSGEGLFFFIK